jgi:hypothetical protein
MAQLGQPAPNWRLEAAITGTLGSVPPLWRQASCLPVSAASSRVIHWLGHGGQVALAEKAPLYPVLFAANLFL